MIMERPRRAGHEQGRCRAARAHGGRLLEVAGDDRAPGRGLRAGGHGRSSTFPSPVTRASMRRALTRIPGIGVQIAGQIREIAGKANVFRSLEELRATIPGCRSSASSMLPGWAADPATPLCGRGLVSGRSDDLEAAVKGRRTQEPPGVWPQKRKRRSGGGGVIRYRERPDWMIRPEADAVLGSRGGALSGWAVCGRPGVIAGAQAPLQKDRYRHHRRPWPPSWTASRPPAVRSPA